MPILHSSLLLQFVVGSGVPVPSTHTPSLQVPELALT